MKTHWTDSDFLARLYELNHEELSHDDSHLDECPDCQARWNQWLAARKNIVASPEVSPTLLTRQRALIHDRIEHRPSASWLKWSPAVAVAGMALFAILWKSPVQEKPSTVTDAQLMSEIYRTVYDTEPDVVEPLRGLFEVKR